MSHIFNFYEFLSKVVALRTLEYNLGEENGDREEFPPLVKDSRPPSSALGVIREGPPPQGGSAGSAPLPLGKRWNLLRRGNLQP